MGTIEQSDGDTALDAQVEELVCCSGIDAAVHDCWRDTGPENGPANGPTPAAEGVLISSKIHSVACCREVLLPKSAFRIPMSSTLSELRVSM
jgi:hypothetical protein